MRNAPRINGTKWLGSAALAAALFGGFLMFAGTSGAMAADRDDHRRDRGRQYSERREEAGERFAYYDRESRDGRDFDRDDRNRRDFREYRNDHDERFDRGHDHRRY